MKKPVIPAIIILMVTLLVSLSCTQPRSTSSSPPVTSAPPVFVPPLGANPGTPGAANDDVVFPPGGFTYRANVHQQGQPDWPSVPQTEVTLRNFTRSATITYRSAIDTRAGETRNNIFFLKISGFPSLDPLKAGYDPENLPKGITVVRDAGMYGGIGGQDRSASRIVMKVNIAPDVQPGSYPFQFRGVIEGVDFGTIPCTVTVMAK